MAPTIACGRLPTPPSAQVCEAPSAMSAPRNTEAYDCGADARRCKLKGNRRLPKKPAIASHQARAAQPLAHQCGGDGKSAAATVRQFRRRCGCSGRQAAGPAAKDLGAALILCPPSLRRANVPKRTAKDLRHTRLERRRSAQATMPRDCSLPLRLAARRRSGHRDRSNIVLAIGN
jgi:hypothetical protein